MPELCMNEGSSDTSIAIGERVNGFELGMGYPGMCEYGDVGSGDEANKVFDATFDPTMVWWDELGLVRAVVTAAYPHLLVTPTTGDFGGTRAQ